MAQAKKRKKFFDIRIPIINKETHLYGYDIEELNGRMIVYDLTRILRGKNILLKLKVTVEGGKAVANPCELKIMPSFIRRMMRKGTNYVEDSFSAECKNAVLKIKPFLITRKKVSRAVRKALRDKAREELTDYVKGKTTEVLFDEIIKNQIQKPLGLKLKKIYPLSLCEIRALKIEKSREKEGKLQKK
jgi:ribosomal protein S3AE